MAIEGGLLSPRLHRVMADNHKNLMLAFKMLKHYGYRRIGVCLEQQVDRYSGHVLRSAANYTSSTTPKAYRVPPLLYDHREDYEWPTASKTITDWIRKHRPEAIIGHSSRLIECVEAAGLRVPEDIGVIHTATDDDVADWAGICSNRRQIGARAVELLVSQISIRDFGLPAFPADTTIEGNWHTGRTLITT